MRVNLRTEARRAEHEIQLRARSDPNDTVWFVALAKEQSALVTGYWFHGCSFLNLGTDAFHRVPDLLFPAGIQWKNEFGHAVERASQPETTLHSPKHSIPCGTVVVLQAGRRAFWFRQRREDLSVLLAENPGLLRGSLLQFAPQPLRDVLSDSHICLLRLRVWNWRMV